MKRPGGPVAPRMGEPFQDVLAAAQAGAGWALERLYLWLAPAVAGYLRVQGASEPDDLASDVFYKAFTRVRTFTGTEDQFRSWIFTIAHNLLIDDRRRGARRPEPVDPHTGPEREDPASDTAQEAFRRLAGDRVRRLCRRLSPDQRDVLMLRIVADLSIEQTAEALGKSAGSVKVLQHRALASLRRHLENTQLDDEAVTL